jgi:hypothetical protein
VDRLLEAPSLERLLDVPSMECCRVVVTVFPAPVAGLESPEGIRSHPLFFELSFVRVVTTWAKT